MKFDYVFAGVTEAEVRAYYLLKMRGRGTKFEDLMPGQMQVWARETYQFIRDKPKSGIDASIKGGSLRYYVLRGADKPPYGNYTHEEAMQVAEEAVVEEGCVATVVEAVAECSHGGRPVRWNHLK